MVVNKILLTVVMLAYCAKLGKYRVNKTNVIDFNRDNWHADQNAGKEVPSVN